MNKKDIKKLAEHLENCQLNAQDTLKITDEFPDMTWDDAYAIQDVIKANKLKRGAKIVGYKAGLTSHAKMKQMGVENPVFGFLVDEFVVADGGDVVFDELIHPKVEPEICFVTKAELKGPGCHVGDVLAATDFVMAGIEVIDSRYRDFKFDLKSVIADNCSSSRFIVGSVVKPPQGLDLQTMGVVMRINNQVVGLGAGAAVVNHPANAVAMLVNHLAARGESLPAGSLVLSGGVTEAVSVKKGDAVSLDIQHLGTVRCQFK